MLQQEIRQEFGHLLRIIIPQDVGLTILKGTVGVMVYTHCMGQKCSHSSVRDQDTLFPIVPVPCSVNKPLVWGHLRIINPQNVGFNILAEDWRGRFG